MSGASEGRGPRPERTPEHQQHPAAFSREAGTHSCNMAPLWRDGMASLLAHLRQRCGIELARQHSAPSCWNRQKWKVRTARASAGVTMWIVRDDTREGWGGHPRDFTERSSLLTPPGLVLVCFMGLRRALTIADLCLKSLQISENLKKDLSTPDMRLMSATRFHFHL